MKKLYFIVFLFLFSPLAYAMDEIDHQSLEEFEQGLQEGSSETFSLYTYALMQGLVKRGTPEANRLQEQENKLKEEDEEQYQRLLQLALDQLPKRKKGPEEKIQKNPFAEVAQLNAQIVELSTGALNKENMELKKQVKKLEKRSKKKGEAIKEQRERITELEEEIAKLKIPEKKEDYSSSDEEESSSSLDDEPNPEKKEEEEKPTPKEGEKKEEEEKKGKKKAWYKHMKFW